jgi:hypothetical protein
MSFSEIHLSLISHTNAGKTTLVRTLLGHDVGEVRDAAHVTEIAEAYTMLSAEEGLKLTLWDTPGFGDTARLLRRLRLAGKPLGWILSQVWDRYADRPFWCSQQAIRNARDNADVILYLVNASEDPEDAGYVRLEMEILTWIEKPVVVLLNQMGPPRDDAAREEDIWRTHLQGFAAVREVLTLDAFARCWVQESVLLRLVAKLVPPAKQPAMAALTQTWHQKNLERFHASMQILAEQLAQAACDREVVGEKSQRGRMRALASLVSVHDPSGEARAMALLAERLDTEIRASTERLIQQHGLGGHAAKEVLRRLHDDYATSQPAKEGFAAVLGGMMSGALGGLGADLAAGGLTFGGGMVAGGILGALGAGGVAHGYNRVRGEHAPSVRWSEEFFEGLVRSALLRYLAVAHFGRGRGDYAQSEHPTFWQGAVAEVVASERKKIQAIWKTGKHCEDPDSLASPLKELLTADAARLLKQFYPAAGSALPRGMDDRHSG